MFNTKEKALAGLRTLGLPPIFEEIWTDRGPEEFCLCIKAPRKFFGVFADEIDRSTENWIPLLEHDDEALIFDLAAGKYLSHWYEECETEEIGTTYQQFLSYVFLDLADAGFEDIVIDVAGAFRYKYLQQFLEYIAKDHGAFEKFEKARKAFIASTV